MKAIDFDNIHEQKYYSNVFNESLRIEPPVMFSSTLTVTEDVNVGKYTLYKGTPFFIGMYNLHKDESEWQ